MKRLFAVVLLCPFFSFAQSATNKNDSTSVGGVYFEHLLTWQEILKKAKIENKHIFVDCYASWCGPCKMMDKNVYGLPATGAFMNSQFISVKLQMDTSKNDDFETRRWYAAAHEMMKMYHVEAYPTYLFFSPDGGILHRELGYQKPKDFLLIAKQALEPEHQYYSLLDAYKRGKKGFLDLPPLAREARRFRDLTSANEIATKYLHQFLDKQSREEVFTDANLNFVGEFRNVLSSSDPVFDYFLHYKVSADTIADEYQSFTTDIVNYIVEKEAIRPEIDRAKRHARDPNWTRISRRIRNRFGGNYVDKNLISAKVDWYRNAKNWRDYAKYLVEENDFINFEKLPNIPNNIVYLNNCAWDVFLYSSDQEELRKAIVWSDWTIKMSKDAGGGNLDTKANLLYKMGDTGDAILLEKKALETASKQDKAAIEKNLQKMEHGDPTWSSR